MEKIQEVYEKCFTTITPYVPSFVSDPLEAREERLDETLKRLQEAEERELQQLRAAQEEADAILTSIRKVSAETGIAQQANHFKKEADKHEKAARWWLMSTVILGLVTASFAYLGVHLFITAEESITARTIQDALTRLIIFAILSFGLFFCSRNYRAHRHNYVINTHRVNALSTFKEFVNATEDRTVKDAILLKSTETIFTPAISGYLVREPEVQGSSQILEIVRGAIDKGSR